MQVGLRVSAKFHFRAFLSSLLLMQERIIMFLTFSSSCVINAEVVNPVCTFVKQYIVIVVCTHRT